MKSVISLIILAFCGSVNFAYAEPIELCGQVVEYKIEEPAADVPNSMKDFLGVWSGHTTVEENNTPCIAFVVQSVEAHGRVTLQQAWSGVGAKKSAGVMSWIGQIVNETALEMANMVLISPQVSYQLKVNYWNKKEMYGFVVDTPYGKFPANLKKLQ